MLLTKLKERLQVDEESESRKLIKSVLDIINPPAEQSKERGTGSGEQFDRDHFPKGQPKIVLHIDDDNEDREMVHDVVKSIDPSIIIIGAENGKSGIELLKKAKLSGNLPCLIILDVHMPGLSGFETYNEIKNDDAMKDVPAVIFTTAATFKSGHRKGNEHLPIFIKPENFKDLDASLRSILTHCKGQ